MRAVKIMRGLPGSGKSTYAAQTWPLAYLASADQFFCRETGAYKFDPAKLPDAHNYCLNTFLEYLREGVDLIVVDNTNVRSWEIAPYYRLAEAFGYDVEILWIVAQPDLCKVRNIHGVPPHIVDQMANSFEAIPPFWRQKW